MDKKPKLSFWNIWNMSFGFLGIQFGFALQGGSMSRIFETLGAAKNDIPMLWIFAPLAGLVVQPIIGYMSDRTWNTTWGRRKPYFFIGAVLASIVLVFMPYSPVLWVAVGSLLLLDTSINISMEPFRALVADLLPDSQRSYGFVVQTLIIGIGTWVASQLPKFLSGLGVSNVAADNVIPDNVKLSFLIGGIIFFLAILYTILTTKEYPPEDIEEFEKEKEETAGVAHGVKEIMANLVAMPTTMKKLGIVQFFSWFAFFTMWSMSNPALTEHVFGAAKPNKDSFDLGTNDKSAAYDAANLAYNNASDMISSAMGMYGLTSMIFALVLTIIASRMTINRKWTHLVSLVVGGLGFILMLYTKDETMLNICFACIGIAWGSILSMPYAMLSSAIDADKMGLFMGLFNMFIVLPQILAAVGLTWIYTTFIGEASINAMVLAGICLIIAGLSNLLITNPNAIRYQGEI